MMATSKLAIPLLTAGQINKHTTHNDALQLIDFQLNTIVEQVGLNAPPGSPTTGKTYVIGASPTGAWASYANKMASYDGVSWLFFDPSSINSPGPGWTILDKTTNRLYRLNNSNLFIKTGLGFGATGGVQIGDNTTDDGYGGLYADTSRANKFVLGSVGLADATVLQFFTHSAPSQQFYATSGASNEKVWINRYSGNILQLTIANDNGSSETTWLKVFRTAASPTYVTLPNGNFGVGISTSSQPDRKFHVVETNATSNTVLVAGKFSRFATVEPAVGIGVGLEFEVQTDLTPSIVKKIAGTQNFVCSNVTGSSESFYYTLSLAFNGNTPVEILRADKGNWGFYNSTVKSWGSSLIGVQVGYSAAIEADKSSLNPFYINNNAYFSDALRYSTAGKASRIKVGTDDFIVSFAPTGTADNTISGLVTFLELTPTTGIFINVEDTANNGITRASKLRHSLSSGTPSNGLGVGGLFELPNSASSYISSAAVDSVWVVATSSSEKAKLSLKTYTSGSLTEKAYVSEGLVVGSPTGGDKGVGAGNFQEVYLNGTLLGSIGINQTIHDDFGVLVANTEYQNTGSVPRQISVIVQGQASAVGYTNLLVGSSSPPTQIVSKCGIGSMTNGTDFFGSVSYIIPAGYYYKVVTSNMDITDFAGTY